MVNIYAVQLQDLLPESLKQDPDIVGIAEAITQELQAISQETIKCVLLSRINDLSEPVLDGLAWHFHVDFYDTSLGVTQKRELVKNSLPWHKRKGTPAVIEELVTSVFSESKVQEWFQYEGQPYHFRVVFVPSNVHSALKGFTHQQLSQYTHQQITNEEQHDTLIAEVTKAINSVKNVRSVFDGFIVYGTHDSLRSLTHEQMNNYTHETLASGEPIG